MTTSDMVRRLSKENHVSLSELARRVGQSPQNFSKKLQRETLTLDELNLIGQALGVSFEQCFVFPNGRRISTESFGNSGIPDSAAWIRALHSDHPLRKALTGDYDTVIYVDGPTGHCTFYAMPEEIKNCFGKVLDRNPGISIVSSLLVENCVAPEDRKEVSTFLDMYNLRYALSHAPIVSKVFRYVNEKGERYSELRVVRVGDGEKLQGAVIAIIDRDEVIREKVESNARNEKILAVTASLASTCSFVVSVNMKNDSAWICGISRPLLEVYGNIDNSEIPFRGVVLPVLLRDVCPDDAGRIERGLSPDVIRDRLSRDHDYNEGFRYRYGDRYYFADMRVLRYGDGSDPDCFVVAFLNRDAEISAAKKHRDELIQAKTTAEETNELRAEAVRDACSRMRSSLGRICTDGTAAKEELLGLIEELETVYQK